MEIGRRKMYLHLLFTHSEKYSVVKFCLKPDFGLTDFPSFYEPNLRNSTIIHKMCCKNLCLSLRKCVSV